MDATYENGRMRIRLPDKIDTANASAVEAEILGLYRQSENADLILDASELTYISSRGLRIILKLIQLTNERLAIENVNSEAYEVFSMTKFTELIRIEEKLAFVDVTGLQLLGKGAIGKVYRLNDEQVLKVYSDGRSRETLEEELQTFSAAFLAGISTMIPFRIVETNEGCGFIFELVLSDLLANSLTAEPEKLPVYAREMAGLMKELAGKELDTSVMKNAAKAYEASMDGIEELVSPEDVERIRRLIRAVPERNTCVHGDLHAGNIMLMEDQLLLIDMDDFGYGHPVWDMAQLYVVYGELIREEAIFRKLFSLPGEMDYEHFVMNICHMPSALASALFEGIRDVYFASLSKEEREACEKVSRLYANILVLRYDFGTIRGRDVDGRELEEKRQVAEHYMAALRKQEMDELPGLFAAWSKLV